MSTAPIEQTTMAADGGHGSGDPPPAGARPSSIGDRLYRVVWRWHFYAGMIIAPALIVVAASGALYIFKDELEAVIYPGVTYVEPAAQRASYERQIAAVRAAIPATPRILFLQVFTNPQRATSMFSAEKAQLVYVDPYRGHYLGAIEKGGFLDIVLKVHRTLFLDTTARIIIELTPDRRDCAAKNARQ
ncbi:MAG TPA: PepSY domain-containing protein [Planctomycetaceae bacterium]|jgi:uncharacterized iron-regulated membrane protein